MHFSLFIVFQLQQVLLIFIAHINRLPSTNLPRRQQEPNQLQKIQFVPNELI